MAMKSRVLHCSAVLDYLPSLHRLPSRSSPKAPTSVSIRQHGPLRPAERCRAPNSVRFSARSAVGSAAHAPSSGASRASAYLPAPFADAKAVSAIAVPKAPVANSPRREEKKLNFFQRAAATALDAFEEGFVANVLERPHGLSRTVDPAVQIAGNFTPVGETPPVRALPVTGRIPPFINGVYARNGANPHFDPVAGHHLCSTVAQF